MGRHHKIESGLRAREFLFSEESIAELTIPGGMDPFNSLPGGLGDEPRLVHHCEPAYSFIQVLSVVLGWLI